MRRLAALAALIAAGCASAPPAPAVTGDVACALGDEDRAWLTAAPGAWQLVERDVFRLGPLPQKPSYYFFDAACSYVSADGRVWTAAQHHDAIRTPDGETHEPGVVSFKSQSKDGPFMLMSLPSIWRAAGVPDRGNMASFLNSVFVHEMAHVRQSGELSDRVTKVAESHGIDDDSLSDDIVQTRFKDNADFKASVERERDILLAGFSGNDAAARNAAREALTLIEARRERYFTGENAALLDLEDIFLTLEGVGQLSGYSWLAHPKGGARPSADAIAGMRTRWWSQEEGMAIMLIVSRLVPDWRQRTFSDHPQTALQLLTLAAAAN